MSAPKKVKLGEDAERSQEAILPVYINGEQILYSVVDAISLINQVSGVLLAHEYNDRGKSSDRKNLPGATG